MSTADAKAASAAVLGRPAVNVPLWESLLIFSIAGLVTSIIVAKAFSWDMVITYLLMSAVVAVGIGLSRLTMSKVPSVIFIITLGAASTSSISPIADWLVRVSSSVDMLSMITGMLTVAGFSLGKDLPLLRSIGWKIIPVGTVAIVASFILSAVVAEFALGMWGS